MTANILFPLVRSGFACRRSDADVSGGLVEPVACRCCAYPRPLGSKTETLKTETLEPETLEPETLMGPPGANEKRGHDAASNFQSSMKSSAACQPFERPTLERLSTE
jgi:hypothetical protein